MSFIYTLLIVSFLTYGQGNFKEIFKKMNFNKKLALAINLGYADSWADY